MSSFSRRGFFRILASVVPASVIVGQNQPEPKEFVYYGDIIHGYNYSANSLNSQRLFANKILRDLDNKKYY